MNSVRNISLMAAFALFFPMASAQSQLWFNQFGVPGPAPGGEDVANAAAPDAVGGVFVAGHTYGSLGGPIAGSMDVFLARFDENGAQQWVRQIGTPGLDDAHGAAPDAAGGVYVVGRAGGDLGGPNAGNRDVFVARYDASGSQLWIRQIGTFADDSANAAAPDGSGGVFIAGTTLGSLGGPNATPVCCAQDVFIARYDPAGLQIWIRQFGTVELDTGNVLAPDGAGGAYLAGNTWGSLAAPHAGRLDTFLRRYDGSGNVLWTRQLGTSEGDGIGGLSPDGAGGVFVAGGTGGSLGGPSAGSGDAFLARYDSAGNQLWIRQFGTSTTDWAGPLAPDGAGGVLIVGATGAQAFVWRYTGAGVRLWDFQFGRSGMDFPRAAATDGAGGLFIAGSVREPSGPNPPPIDAFVARFGDACYADCDQSGTLDIFDFLCFQNSFVSGEPYACDCNPDPVCDIFDFLCFQNAFVGGCP